MQLPAGSSENNFLKSSDAAVFFVVGSVRSGTTLLRLMLDNHSRISCFGEFEYVVDLLKDRSCWPTKTEFAEFLSTERRYLSTGLELNSTTDYPSSCQYLFDAQTKVTNEELIARGAVVHRHFSDLLRLWPNAKFIYLYRDGRDVAVSCAEQGFCGNAWVGVDFWIRAESDWQKLCQSVMPDRRLEVCYESLVSDPVQQLETICRFVGVDFDQRMLSYPSGSTYSAPDPGLLGKWKRTLSGSELEHIENRIASRLLDRGYALGTSAANAPGAYTRFIYRCNDRWNRCGDNVNRFGFWLTIRHMVAKKFGLRGVQAKTQNEINSIIATIVK